MSHGPLETDNLPETKSHQAMVARTPTRFCSRSSQSRAPIAVAALLTLGRGHLSAADNALVLVVVTVAVAVARPTEGRQHSQLLCRQLPSTSCSHAPTSPSASAVRPTRRRRSVRRRRPDWWGAGRHAAASTAVPHQRAGTGLASVHGLAEQIANGEEPDFVLIAVATELQNLLSLADCRFVWGPSSGKGARIESDGTVRLNPLIWPS